MLSFNLGRWRISIKQQIIVTLIMLAFAIAYMIESWNLSFESLLFPRFLYICIAITGFLSIKKFVQVRKIDDQEEGKNEENIQSFHPSRKLLYFFIQTFLMLLLLKMLGTVLTIVTYLAVTMYFLGVRKKTTLILVPICIAAIIYGLFGVWLSVPIPVGILGF